MYWRLIGLCLIIFSFFYCPLAFAEGGKKKFNLNIESRSLDRALLDFGQQTGTPLLFSYEVVEDRISNEVVGSYTTTQAINLLLEGTGLRGKILEEGELSIEELPQEGKGNIQVIIATKNSKDNKKHARQNRSAIITSASALLAGLGNTALAQDAPVATNRVVNTPQVTELVNNEGEEVITTGSRIARSSNALSAVPLQIISGEQFSELGTNDIAEILAEIPGVSDSISQATSNTSIQNAGLASTQLRRLGDNSTLVLIDGKRAVSNSGNAERVSLGTIPGGLLKTIEVTTGGASAIYGSDAIAGVLNFILEDDFTGFQIESSISVPQESGGEDFQVEAKWGTEFANGKGYFLVSGEYRDENAIFADSSRPLSVANVEFDDPDLSTGNSFANEADTPGCDITNPDGSINGDRFCLLPSFSDFTPGGVFEGDAFVTRDGQFVNDQGGLTDRATFQDFFNDFDGADFRTGRSLTGARELTNIGLITGYDLTENARFNLTGIYSNVDTETIGALGTGAFTNSAFGPTGQRQVIGNIPADNPFIPQVVEDTRFGGVFFVRRFDEVGPNTRASNRETIRLFADVSGTIANKYDYEVYGTFGRYDQEQRNLNELNLRNIQQALNVEDDGNGGFQCEDATARANGCVPLNVFGLNSISSEAADFIRYDGFAEQNRTQYTAGGFVSGDLFNLKPGPVKFVLGGEFRREEQETIGDPDSDLIGGIDGDPDTPDVDITTITTFTDIDAAFDVVEGFAELDIPIIEDVLSFQAAGRVADYSTVGTIFSVNAGGVFKPIDGVTLRGQYSRSQRAPTITEVFSDLRVSGANLNGPCDGLMPDGTGIDQPASAGAENVDLALIASNCLSIPGIQAFFADPDNAGEAFQQSGGILAPNAGNPNVEEETANTITAGIILQPSYVPNLTLIVDYYRIDVDDIIDGLGVQRTVDFCLAETNFPNNPFCDQITRNPLDGGIEQVINAVQNLNSRVVSGIDASIQYTYENAAVPGKFDVDLRYTHYLKDELSVLGIGNQFTDSSTLGEIGEAENEFRGRLGYRNGPLRLVYTLTFEEGGVDDINNNANPGDDRFFEVGNEFFHRIFASYTFGEDNRYTLYGGINNIGNNFGPLVPSGTRNGNSRNIITDVNEVAGREFLIGARVRF